MRISQRLLILFIVISFAFAAFFFLFYNIKQEEMRVYKEGDLQQRKLTIDAIFSLKTTSQLRLSEDYTIWDDMLDFVQKPDIQWAENNLNTLLVSFDNSIVQVYNAQGDLVYSVADEGLKGLDDYRVEPEVIRLMSIGKKQIYYSGHGQIILSCAVSTIHPTIDMERSSPPAGFIMIGKAWDYRYLADLAKSLNYDIRISYAEPGIESNNEQYNTKIIHTISDLRGKTIAWLIFYSSNPFLAQLRNLGNLILFGTMGFILVFLLMQFFLIQQWITQPLKLISNSLKNNNPEHIRALNDKRNEFADVALLIEQFFVQKESLISEIQERVRTEAKLREMEEQTRQIFLTSPEAIIVTDLKANILAANDETARLLEIDHAEHITSDVKNISDLIAPQNRKQLNAILNELSGDCPVRNIELDIITQAGRNLSALVSASVILDEDRIPQKLIFICRDLSELKSLEYQLRQSQKMESIGTLAGGIAHDFNNIITIIAGYIALSAGKINTSTEAQDDLDEALKACLRAKSLIGKILTFSRQSELDVEELVLADVIEDALPMIRATISSKVEIHTDIQSFSYIQADSTELQQVLINLATNAFHAMRPDGGTLSIRLSEISGFELVGLDPAVELDNSYLHLTLSDTGCGIPHDILGRIFDPYFSTKSPGEGTGLGLSIVHGIIHGYRGFIHVQSIQGEGSSFHIYLPIVEQPKKVKREAKEQDYPFEFARILMVDDEPALAEIFCDILIQNGYEVSPFTQSHLALNAFLAKPEDFDLVIADINMPIMDGIKLAGKIKEVKSIPIVLYTGFLDHSLQQRAEAADIRFILNKPILPVDMVSAVRKVMYLWRGEVAR